MDGVCIYTVCNRPRPGDVPRELYLCSLAPTLGLGNIWRTSRVACRASVLVFLHTRRCASRAMHEQSLSVVCVLLVVSDELVKEYEFIHRQDFTGRHQD